MRKLAAGSGVAQHRIPLRLGAHLIAARYGTTAAAVRDTWPADDYLDALAFLGVTGGIV